MEHRVTVKPVKTLGQWEGQCDACPFWTGMAGLTSTSEKRVREAAAFHEEKHAKKAAAKARRSAR